MTNAPTASTIPVLGTTLQPPATRVSVKYNPAGTKGLRVQNRSNGRPVPGSVKANLRNAVNQLEAALEPFRVTLLRGTVETPPRYTGQPLITRDVRALVALLLERAAATPGIVETGLVVTPRLVILPGGDGARDINAYVEVASAAENPETVHAAAETYAAHASSIWGNGVGAHLAPWAIASGLHEIRLKGEITPGVTRRPESLALQGALHTA